MAKGTKKIVVLVPLFTLIGLMGIYFLFPGVTCDLLQKAERSLAGLSQHSIDVNGMHIEYLEGGQGDVLVLLHGFGANKDNWTRFGRHLTSHFRLIVPDLPGSGQSSAAPDGNYKIGIQAERVRKFVRKLGIKSFHLGGNSMGGYIAGVYASRHPNDLKSLLLIAPAGVASSEKSEMIHLLLEGGPNPLVVESMEEYDHLLEFVFVKRPFIPYPVKYVLAQEAIRHRSLNHKIFKQLHSSLETVHLEKLLKGGKVPTLILWGEKDRVLHVSGSEILESVMPEAKAQIMENIGHVPMIEKPRKTAQLYLEFLGLRQTNRK